MGGCITHFGVIFTKRAFYAPLCPVLVNTRPVSGNGDLLTERVEYLVSDGGDHMILKKKPDEHIS